MAAFALQKDNPLLAPNDKHSKGAGCRAHVLFSCCKTVGCRQRCLSSGQMSAWHMACLIAWSLYQALHCISLQLSDAWNLAVLMRSQMQPGRTGSVCTLLCRQYLKISSVHSSTCFSRVSFTG